MISEQGLEFIVHKKIRSCPFAVETYLLHPTFYGTIGTNGWLGRRRDGRGAMPTTSSSSGLEQGVIVDRGMKRVAEIKGPPSAFDGQVKVMEY